MTEIKNIFKTVAMVTAFSCAERFIGFLYRIYLSRSLGAEGLGLYQISLSVLGLFMTITSSGIPITVSRMIAKNKNSALVKKDAAAVTSGILLTLAVSIPITFLVAIKSPLVSFLFSDERCMTVLCIMIPGLAFTSVYAVIRGFFWGNSEFFTYSVIELAEEGVMAIVGIILVNGAIETFAGVQKASYAVLISYLFSFTASTIVFFLKGGRLSSPKDSFLPLLYSSAPITAMRTSTSLINTLVSVLLPARLIYYGATSSAAVAEFGKVFGMAIPMIFMPSTLIGSLAVVLVPELSDNYYSGKALTLKNNIEKAVKFSCFVACMIIPAFFAVGEELGSFLYSDPSAGAYITKSAAIMLPLSLSIISTSILNSLGKEKLTLVSFLIGASVMLTCIYFLPSVIGVNSLIAGMFLSFSISSAINLTCLFKSLKRKPQYFFYMIKSAMFTVPTALIGVFLRNIMLASPDVAVICAVTLLTCGFEFAFFVVFGMLDFFTQKEGQKKNFLVKSILNSKGNSTNNSA